MEAQDRATASAAAGKPEDAPLPHAAKTVGSFVADGASPARKKKGTSDVSRRSGYGSQRADNEKPQRAMLRQLERLEEGHTKAKAIFPEVVLGHLFMKKYMA